MKPPRTVPVSAWLLDGNLLVALALEQHSHHQAAGRWFDAQDIPFATCAVTQGTLLRLHLQLAEDPTPTAAWAALRAICAHRDHVFWDDGFSYLDVSPATLLGHRQITDAWLAQLARRRKGRVATFDEAFAKAHPTLATLVPASV